MVLTSDRLFFLPYVDHPRLDGTAFWLCELSTAGAAGRNRFAVLARDEKATFHLVGSRPGPAGLIGDLTGPWLAAIRAAEPDARPRTAFDRATRRAVG